MAVVRDIKQKDDPVLRKKAKPVKNPTDPLIRQLAEDMVETMYAAPGVGLAAPQVGESKRILVADCGEKHGGLHVLVNPKILSKEGTQIGIEGCLSIPGWYGDVERAAKITVKAQDLNGKWFKMEAEALLARCFQHEVDHLDGILFTDKAVNLRELTSDELEKEYKERESSPALI